MKRITLFGIRLFLFIAVSLVFAQTSTSKTFKVKGRVTDLIESKSVQSVTLTVSGLTSGATVSTGPITTDVDGKFGFTLTNPTGLPVSFSLAAQSGFLASNPNISNFWETTYTNQIAGIRCRSENAFCFKDEVWRDKGSSSRYDFVLDPAITCNPTTSTPQTITNPTGVKVDSTPAVATDGSTVVVFMKGDDNALWTNSNSSATLSSTSWKGWVNVAGVSINDGDPKLTARAVGRNKFAIFFLGTDSKKYGILRDKSKSKSPFVPISDIDLTFILPIPPTDLLVKTKFKTIKYQFSKVTDNIQYQTCTT